MKTFAIGTAARMLNLHFGDLDADLTQRLHRVEALCEPWGVHYETVAIIIEQWERDKEMEANDESFPS
ncbi:MAG: hypothetical protein ACOC8H_00810 [bacterium]